MKRLITSTLAAVALIGFGGLLFLAAPDRPVEAATPNLAAGYDVQVIPLHLSGQYIATETGVVRLQLPFSGSLIGVSASARASGGTSPTLTVDVQDDAVSVLSAPVAVTAGAVSEATIATAAIGDESVITIDLAITGTSPTWDDITILLTFVRT